MFGWALGISWISIISFYQTMHHIDEEVVEMKGSTNDAFEEIVNTATLMLNLPLDEVTHRRRTPELQDIKQKAMYAQADLQKMIEEDLRYFDSYQCSLVNWHSFQTPLCDALGNLPRWHFADRLANTAHHLRNLVSWLWLGNVRLGNLRKKGGYLLARRTLAKYDKKLEVLEIKLENESKHFTAQSVPCHFLNRCLLTCFAFQNSTESHDAVERTE